jgi:hypothetical protein
MEAKVRHDACIDSKFLTDSILSKSGCFSSNPFQPFCVLLADSLHHGIFPLMRLKKPQTVPLVDELFAATIRQSFLQAFLLGRWHFFVTLPAFMDRVIA